MSVEVKIFRLKHNEDLPTPHYLTKGSAGMDIYAALNESIILKPMERQLIPTGLKMEIPQGYEMQIRPRSGLAYKHGITCLNTPGTIDSDYRGEIFVLLINLSNEKFVIERGMRIAQAIFASVIQVRSIDVNIISETVRGSGGFGSTGY